MATKKKRNKRYHGEDAVSAKPTVTKISVPSRSKPAKWWYENKKTIKNRGIIIGVIVLFVLVINWLVQVIF